MRDQDKKESLKQAKQPRHLKNRHLGIWFGVAVIFGTAFGNITNNWNRYTSEFSNKPRTENFVKVHDSRDKDKSSSVIKPSEHDSTASSFSSSLSESDQSKAGRMSDSALIDLAKIYVDGVTGHDNKVEGIINETPESVVIGIHDGQSENSQIFYVTYDARSGAIIDESPNLNDYVKPSDDSQGNTN